MKQQPSFNKKQVQNTAIRKYSNPDPTQTEEETFKNRTLRFTNNNFGGPRDVSNPNRVEGWVDNSQNNEAAP